MKSIYINVMFILILLTACHKVTVKVPKLPSNTPKGAKIYITGNFNQWNTSDRDYVLKMNADSCYYVTMPFGWGKLQCKFTRGDWTSVETDQCGYPIQNRIFNYSETDTIIADIESWSDFDPIDCATVTLIVTGIPENTPKNDNIVVSGTFNSWQPNSNKFKLKSLPDGRREITIPKMKSIDLYEFKFTRGDLSTEEVDKQGNEMPNRSLTFGRNDTLYMKIDNWKDLVKVVPEEVTLIINKYPVNTPERGKIYLVGSFNYWYPRDRRYILENKKGYYSIKVPRTFNEKEFKFTRGDWTSEEVDQNGDKIPNRQFHFNNSDTVYFEIQNWIDFTSSSLSVTFIIRKLPETPMANNEIFLASNINNWNPGNFNFMFNKGKTGFLELKIQALKERNIEFKITRGSWASEELDQFGNIISNRQHFVNSKDTIWIDVPFWKDIKPLGRDMMTIIVNKYPLNSRPDDNIYIAGTFNSWDPGDKNYILKKQKNGNYFITLNKTNFRNQVEYKFTRGNWHKEEADAEGNPVSNRSFIYGYTDTLYLTIENWKDLSN